MISIFLKIITILAALLGYYLKLNKVRFHVQHLLSIASVMSSKPEPEFQHKYFVRAEKAINSMNLVLFGGKLFTPMIRAGMALRDKKVTDIWDNERLALQGLTNKFIYLLDSPLWFLNLCKIAFKLKRTTNTY